MNFKPMGDRVLVEAAPVETKTKSGFFIPDTLAEKTNTGTVLAVGPGKTTKDGVVIPVSVNVDDRVMYIPGSGIPVKVDGENFLVLKEEELIAVVD